MVLGPGLILVYLKGALTSRPMLRGRDFHLAQLCVGVAHLRDSFFVNGDFVLVVGVICLPVARRPWCLDVEEKQCYLRRVPVAVPLLLCGVDDFGALVGVNLAWMSLLDTQNLLRKVSDLVAVVRMQHVIVLDVPTVEVLHVRVRFRSIMM